MAVKPNLKVELNGPLWDPKVKARVRKAIGDSIEEVGDIGEGIARGVVRGKGFVLSGKFVDSVESESRRRSGAIGYAKITVQDSGVWPKKDRPTKTWMERGVRKGVRLRKGVWAFRTTARRLKKMDINDKFWFRIQKAVE